MLSVIVPAYNAGNTLAEQLNALKNQVYDGDWEVVVVNNGSTDNTVAVVEDCQLSMPCLRLVHAPDRQNKSYARNYGVKEAIGNSLLFCDADDVVAPNWVGALATALSDHDFVGGAQEVETLNQTAVWRPAPFDNAQKPIFNFLPFVSSSNMGMSRQAFEAAGGFSEAFVTSQDVDISWRLQLLGYKPQYVPEALVYYRYRNSWRSTWRQTVATAEYQVLLFKNFTSHGMPKPSWQETRKRYRYLIRRLPRLRNEGQTRALWVRRLAISWGRIRGTVRFGILCL